MQNQPNIALKISPFKRFVKTVKILIRKHKNDKTIKTIENKQFCKISHQTKNYQVKRSNKNATTPHTFNKAICDIGVIFTMCHQEQITRTKQQLEGHADLPIRKAIQGHVCLKNATKNHEQKKPKSSDKT